MHNTSNVGTEALTNKLVSTPVTFDHDIIGTYARAVVDGVVMVQHLLLDEFDKRYNVQGFTAF